MCPAMVYRDEDTGYKFVWHGGEYIDVYAPDTNRPFEVINVWDPEADAAEIDRTHNALRAEAREWIKAYA